MHNGCDHRAGEGDNSVGPLVGGTDRENGGSNLSVHADEYMRREQESLGAQTAEGHGTRKLRKEGMVLGRQIQQRMGLDLSERAHQAKQ